MHRRTQIKRVLCVAEKNDAAKCIAEIMSNGRSRRVRMGINGARSNTHTGKAVMLLTHV